MNHFIDVNSDSMLCYPMFNPYSHIKDMEIPYEKASIFLLGWDFGLDPSCSIIIVDTEGLFYVRGEVSIHGVGVERAIPEIKSKLQELEIPFKETISYMDPSGMIRAQSNEYQCYEALSNAGFNIGSNVSQNVMSRLEAVRDLLYVPGKFGIHSSCVMLIKGFLSTYHFKDNIKKYEIEKNSKEGHIHDSLQYAALGYKNQNGSYQRTLPSF